MQKLIKSIYMGLPILLQLLRRKTPPHGKHIMKSGGVSLGIASLFSTGRIGLDEIDPTIIIIVHIIEVVCYTVGTAALIAGATQADHQQNE